MRVKSGQLGQLFKPTQTNGKHSMTYGVYGIACPSLKVLARQMVCEKGIVFLMPCSLYGNRHELGPTDLL